MDLVDMEAAREDPEDTEGLVAPVGTAALEAPGLPWVAVCTTARRWGIGPHRPDPRWVAAGIARPGTVAAAAACCR